MEQKKEPPGKIPSESNVPAFAPPPARRESESKELRSQIVMKAERPATKEASGEVRKEAPKRVAKEIPKEVSKETPKPAAKEIPKEAPGEVSREVPKEIPKEVSKEVPKEVPAEIPKEAPEEVAKEAVKEAPKEVSKEVPKEVSKEIAKEIPKPVATETPKEVAKEAVKEAPKESSKEVSKVTLHPGQNLAIWTGEGKAVSSRPSLLAKEEEVKQFFSNYVDRYHRKDVSAFLSLFSTKVVQNQTEGLEAIGNLYAKWIDESEELRYQIEGMKIEIYQNRAEVKARFRIDRKLKKDGAEKVSKGSIRWVLAREGGRLKIISVDY